MTFCRQPPVRGLCHLAFQGPWDEAPCAENNDFNFGYDVLPMPHADRPDF